MKTVIPTCRDGARLPTLVITSGPEGGYGHADHRLVGDVVTQLFQAGALPANTRLYYAGFTEDRVTSSPPWRSRRPSSIVDRP